MPNDKKRTGYYVYTIPYESYYVLAPPWDSGTPQWQDGVRPSKIKVSYWNDTLITADLYILGDADGEANIPLGGGYAEIEIDISDFTDNILCLIIEHWDDDYPDTDLQILIEDIQIYLDEEPLLDTFSNSAWLPAGYVSEIDSYITKYVPDAGLTENAIWNSEDGIWESVYYDGTDGTFYLLEIMLPGVNWAGGPPNLDDSWASGIFPDKIALNIDTAGTYNVENCEVYIVDFNNTEIGSVSSDDIAQGLVGGMNYSGSEPFLITIKNDVPTYLMDIQYIFDNNGPYETGGGFVDCAEDTLDDSASNPCSEVEIGEEFSTPGMVYNIGESQFGSTLFGFDNEEDRADFMVSLYEPGTEDYLSSVSTFTLYVYDGDNEEPLYRSREFTWYQEPLKVFKNKFQGYYLTEPLIYIIESKSGENFDASISLQAPSFTTCEYVTGADARNNLCETLDLAIPPLGGTNTDQIRLFSASAGIVTAGNYSAVKIIYPNPYTGYYSNMALYFRLWNPSTGNIITTADGTIQVMADIFLYGGGSERIGGTWDDNTGDWGVVDHDPGTEGWQLCDLSPPGNETENVYVTIYRASGSNCVVEVAFMDMNY